MLVCSAPADFTLASNNKTKAMWNIITSETDRKGKTEDIFCFSSGNDEDYDYQDISDSFKNIFLLGAVKITLSIKLVIIIITQGYKSLVLFITMI